MRPVEAKRIGLAPPVYEICPIGSVFEFVETLIDAKHETSGRRYDWDGSGRRIARNVEGYMAEIAACELYGLEFEWGLWSGRGDAGHDIQIGSHRLGIKATSNPRGRLLVKVEETKRYNAPGYYLLCFTDIDAGTVRLAGVVSRKVVTSREPEKVHPKGPFNYVVGVHELRPCRDPKIKEAS